MWNEFNEQTLLGDRNTGGVAPSRHEIARRAYLDKVRIRQEAEQKAGTTAPLFGLLNRMAPRALARVAAIRRVHLSALRTGEAR